MPMDAERLLQARAMEAMKKNAAKLGFEGLDWSTRKIKVKSTGRYTFEFEIVPPFTVEELRAAEARA
jgi:hypothetical protein